MTSKKFKISNIMSLEDKVRVIRAYSMMGYTKYRFKNSHPQIANIIANKDKILRQHSVMQNKLIAAQNAVGIHVCSRDHSLEKIALLEKVMIECYRRFKYRSPVIESCARMIKQKLPIVRNIMNLTSFAPNKDFIKRLRNLCMKAKPKIVDEKEVSSNINDIVKYVLEQENISIEEAQNTYGILLNDERLVWNAVSEELLMPVLSKCNGGKLPVLMYSGNYEDPKPQTFGIDEEQLPKSRVFDNYEEEFPESQTFDTDEDELTLDNDKEDIDCNEDCDHDENESMDLPKLEKLESYEDGSQSEKQSIVSIKSENLCYYEKRLMVLSRTENIDNEEEVLPTMKNIDNVGLTKSEDLDFDDVDLAKSPNSRQCGFVEVYITKSESLYGDDHDDCEKFNNCSIENNFSILKNNQDAVQYLKPLKEFVTLQGDFKEIDTIAQLEAIYLKLAQNELDGEAQKLI